MILSKKCVRCGGKGWERFYSDAFPVMCFACYGHGDIETDASAVLAHAIGCTLHTATRILKGTWRGKGRQYQTEPGNYAVTLIGRLASLAEHEPEFLAGFL